jgi:hypothetical protein
MVGPSAFSQRISSKERASPIALRWSLEGFGGRGCFICLIDEAGTPAKAAASSTVAHFPENE